MMKFIFNSGISIFLITLLIGFGECGNYFGMSQDDHYHPVVGGLQMPNKLPKGLNTKELEIEYWQLQAQNTLMDIINAQQSPKTTSKAKNIILFMGDGMSLTTVAATRMYMGGEEKSLSFEKFPHFGLSKTYCVDYQVADSSCTSTAFLNGVKANVGTMGVTAKVPRYDCNGQNDVDAQTVSIATWAQNECKATGLVTTSKVTDSSPAGLYAHIADHYWENDQKVKAAGCDPNITIDSARQLIENDVAINLKVILAGGRNEFRDKSVLDEENIRGNRGDKRDLINEWIESHSKMGKATYVWNKNGLNNIANDTDYLLGLFSDDHCEYNIDIEQKKLGAVKPMLSEMTVAAIKHLQKERNGYFLFVESARIDTAHHDNFARLALDETKEFSRTIQLARDMTSVDDTLIVVTADHAHTMTYNGYSARGSDILGLNGEKGWDDLPYSTLSYANGKSFHHTYDSNGGRTDITNFNFTDPRLQYMGTVPTRKEAHGGEDVGIYASGPQAHLFDGNYEQSFIPIIMAYIAKIGPYATNSRPKCQSASDASLIFLSNSSITIVILSLVRYFYYYF